LVGLVRLNPSPSTSIKTGVSTIQQQPETLLRPVWHPSFAGKVQKSAGPKHAWFTAITPGQLSSHGVGSGSGVGVGLGVGVGQ
jgi:hypothetical protein